MTDIPKGLGLRPPNRDRRGDRTDSSIYSYITHTA